MDKRDKLLLRYAICYYVALIPFYIGFWYYAKKKLDASLLNTKVNTNGDSNDPNVNKPPPSTLINTLIANSGNVLIVIVVILVVLFFVVSVVMVIRRRKNKQTPLTKTTMEVIDVEPVHSTLLEAAEVLGNAKEAPSSLLKKMKDMSSLVLSREKQNAIEALGYDNKTEQAFRKMMKNYNASATNLANVRRITSMVRASALELQNAIRLEQQDSLSKKPWKNDYWAKQRMNQERKHTRNIERLALVRLNVASSFDTQDIVALVNPKPTASTKGTMALFTQQMDFCYVVINERLLAITKAREVMPHVKLESTTGNRLALILEEMNRLAKQKNELIKSVQNRIGNQTGNQSGNDVGQALAENEVKSAIMYTQLTEVLALVAGETADLLAKTYDMSREAAAKATTSAQAAVKRTSETLEQLKSVSKSAHGAVSSVFGWFRQKQDGNTKASVATHHHELEKAEREFQEAKEAVVKADAIEHTLEQQPRAQTPMVRQIQQHAALLIEQSNTNLRNTVRVTEEYAPRVKPVEYVSRVTKSTSVYRRDILETMFIPQANHANLEVITEEKWNILEKAMTDMKRNTNALLNTRKTREDHNKDKQKRQISFAERASRSARQLVSEASRSAERSTGIIERRAQKEMEKRIEENKRPIQLSLKELGPRKKNRTENKIESSEIGER